MVDIKALTFSFSKKAKVFSLRTAKTGLAIIISGLVSS